MKYNHISIPFTEDYAPLIAEIDKIAKEANVSRSAVIRSILCDAFQFTPKNAIFRIGNKT
jgi:Ribbon-helix-helix protein, copG family